jgi:hypothetical protein
MIAHFSRVLRASKVLDSRRRGVPTERMSNTPQGEAIEVNAEDDTLMVNQEKT